MTCVDHDLSPPEVRDAHYFETWESENGCIFEYFGRVTFLFRPEIYFCFCPSRSRKTFPPVCVSRIMFYKLRISYDGCSLTVWPFLLSLMCRLRQCWVLRLHTDRPCWQLRLAEKRLSSRLFWQLFENGWNQQRYESDDWLYGLLIFLRYRWSAKLYVHTTE